MPSPAPVIPTSYHHLCELVKHSIQTYGHDCDLNHIDVSQMRDFTGVFKEMDFQGDISRWDTSSAESMEQMFAGSTFNGDISKWNVSRVTNMVAMFAHSSFNSDISDWDTSKLVHAKKMFKSSSFTGDISRWNMVNVTSTARMFDNCPFNGDISKWDVSSLSDASVMFAYGAFNGDLSSWNLTSSGHYCNMAQMFLGNTVFSGDLSHWTLIRGPHTVSMFSEDFKGVLPQAKKASGHSYSFYQRLFDDEDVLDTYLAEVPFNHAHAQVLCDSAIRPPWFPLPDYAWFKEMADLALGIGMDPSATAMLVLSEYRERHGQARSTESWSMGDDALCT